jgi:hypothetical protein
VTEHEDNRLVEYLYGEMGQAEVRAFEDAMHDDPQLSESVHGFESMLDTIRSVETEVPSAHLDSLMLARARQQTEKSSSWIRRLLGTPGTALAFSGACALVLAVIVIPQMSPTSQGVEESMAVHAPAKKVAKKAAPEHLMSPKSVRSVDSIEAPLGAAKGDSLGEREGKIGTGFKVGKKKEKRGRLASINTGTPKQAPARQRRKAKSFGGSGGGSGRAEPAELKDQVRSAAEQTVPSSPAPVFAKEMAKDMPDIAEDSAPRSSRGSRASAADEDGDLRLDENRVVAQSSPAKRKNAKARAPAPVALSVPRSASAARRPRAARPAPSPRSARAAPEPAQDDAELEVAALGSADSLSSKSSTDDARQDREVWARSLARQTQKKAKALILDGRIGEARRAYLNVRPSVRGTLAFFELSLWLAQLEYAQGRYADARRYAQEASRSRDQRIQVKAKEVVARVREDQGRPQTRPAATTKSRGQ